jgi:hypothetical protein
MDLGCFIAPKPKGSKNSAPGLQPGSADLVRGASTGEWFLSRRDSTIEPGTKCLGRDAERSRPRGTVEGMVSSRDNLSSKRRPGMSKRQRVERVEYSSRFRASEKLGTPVEKSASDDVRPGFGCHEWFLSQDRFNRPAGTGLFSSSSQALRAWLLSCCPSGTKYTRAPRLYLS